MEGSDSSVLDEIDPSVERKTDNSGYGRNSKLKSYNKILKTFDGSRVPFNYLQLNSELPYKAPPFHLT